MPQELASAIPALGTFFVSETLRDTSIHRDIYLLDELPFSYHRRTSEVEPSASAIPCQCVRTVNEHRPDPAGIIDHASGVETSVSEAPIDNVPDEPEVQLVAESLRLVLGIVVSTAALLYNYVFLLGLSSVYSSQISSLMGAQIPILLLPAAPITIRKREWHLFVASLLKIWKVQSVACALISSAVVAFLQVPSFSNNPITETIGIVVIVCSVAGFLINVVYALHLSRFRHWEAGKQWVKVNEDQSVSRSIPVS